MRHLIVALILLLLCSPCFSKMRHLERKEEPKRNEYLVDKAKEVIMAFGPDYYRDYKEPIISDINSFKETFKDAPVLKNKKLYGRKYYTVTFFYVVSYKDWLKKGIKENDIIPYIATEKEVSL